jgi:hypothetical protein
MARRSEDEIREALSDVLTLYDIKIDMNQKESEEEKTHIGDYSDIISQTQEKLDDLNEKAEEIFKRTGMNREQLEAYAANPNNFSKEQWEALQKVKEACEKYKREARSRIGDPQFEERVEKQERKKERHRFAKKKHWIPL